MKAALILLACLVAVAWSAPAQFGICVEMCSLDGKYGQPCPAGYHCASNGCGHTCQKDNGLTGHKLCLNPQMALCDMWCPNGFALDKDGCAMCRCNTLGTLPGIQ